MCQKRTGLKCAPLIGPRSPIRTPSTATVAPVLASRAMAVLPPERRSAMTPEPTTVAASSREPRPSERSMLEAVLIATATTLGALPLRCFDRLAIAAACLIRQGAAVLGEKSDQRIHPLEVRAIEQIAPVAPAHDQLRPQQFLEME